MDNPPTTPSTPASIRLRRQRGRTPPPAMLVAGPLLGCAFALALLLLLSHGVTGASAAAAGTDTEASSQPRLRSVERRHLEEQEQAAVGVPVDGEMDGNKDKAFSLTERMRPSTLGGDPNNGELLNFGHNEHVVGVRKHHPTTYAEVAELAKAVRAKGGRLRAMGALHSWSNIFPENGTDVVFLDRLKGIAQDPADYSIVTVQAGVLNYELADWADSAARGPGRFSYLSQSTVVGGITFVGACQTASHGSGFVGESTIDTVVGVTLVDYNGEIRHYHEPDPDVKVMAACLGMCGIILDVTVKFNPDTDAVEVTRGRRSLSELFLPRGTPINESYNPLKAFIEGPGFSGGALSYAPYNSAPEVGSRLEADKIDQYHSHDRIWSNAVRKLPGTKPQPYLTNPIIGSQQEPYYDTSAFYPADWATLVIGSRIPHAVFGADRLDHSRPFNPYLANPLAYTVNYAGNPSLLYRGFRSFNTSHASAQHYVHYLADVAAESDFEFAFRLEDDFANLYEAHRVLLEENDWMFRNRGQVPLSMFSGVRWTEASSCPLSHVYGKKGDRFVLVEAIATQGTDGWEEYINRVFNRWRQMRSKKDGSLPKPHWAKWDSRWIPGLAPYIKEVYAEQIKLIRPVVMRLDPIGLFRNKFLSEMFDLPYLV